MTDNNRPPPDSSIIEGRAERALGQVAGMSTVDAMHRGGVRFLPGSSFETRIVYVWRSPPRNRCPWGSRGEVRVRREVKTWDETEMQLRRPRVDLFRGSHKNKGQAP